MIIDTKEYIYTLEIKVRDYEVDVEGIVNNANYLHYLEHTRHEFCESVGLSFRDMHQKGMDPVVSHIDIRYLSSLGLGDRMLSCLAIRRRGPVFVFTQDIFKEDGTPVVRALVDVVSLESGRISRGDALAEIFAPYLAQ